MQNTNQNQTNSTTQKPMDADEFLRKHGFDRQARPIGTRSESIKTIGTPMGGANTFRRRMRRP